MREMRNENEQRRQQRNFLRCRIIPTTKNIYGRRFLCSRLESGICALPRLFFGETTTAARRLAPLYFWPPPPLSRVSPSANKEERDREGRDRCYVLHGEREKEEMHKFLTP